MPLSARADGKNDRVTEGSILSVYGSTTITTLMDGLTENSIQSGLLPRIFFCPADPDAQPRFGMGEDIPSLPSEVVLAVQAWTQGHALEHACMRANKTAGLLSYDADAKALAEATEREGWERRNDQRAGPVAHLWSRFAEKAAQAAVIITWLRDQSATETTGEDYRTAAAIAKASILSLTSLAGRDLLVCGSGTEKEIRRILRIITEAGPTGIERTPIARRAKDIHSRRLDEILTTLEQAGRIQSKTITRTRPQGGDVTIEVYRATEF
jgi:hypothetical protein